MSAKKIIAAVITFVMGLSVVHAQTNDEIMQILDRCAKTFKAAGNIKATYEAAAFENKEQHGSAKGTICISGNKLYINGEDVKIWFDGKTQWTYIPSNNEVSISEPSAEERTRMNPYAFLSIYKTGYTATMTNETVRNETCHCITLTATKSSAMPVIMLTISKDTMLPICIRTKNGTHKWTRISIYEFAKKQRFDSNTFRFDAGKYKGVEIVDLR